MCYNVNKNKTEIEIVVELNVLAFRGPHVDNGSHPL